MCSMILVRYLFLVFSNYFKARYMNQKIDFPEDLPQVVFLRLKSKALADNGKSLEKMKRLAQNLLKVKERHGLESYATTTTTLTD